MEPVEINNGQWYPRALRYEDAAAMSEDTVRRYASEILNLRVHT